MSAPPAPSAPTPTPAPARALAVFALANAGGVIGFLPLLTLLLPIRIQEIAPDGRIGLVTATTLAGAVAASLSNILFGWWSDRSLARGGGRRRFVAAGIVATALAFAAIGSARTPLAIVAAVVGFQVAINAVIAPMLAAMAEEVPDDRKGIAGGLLALGNPLAAAVSALVLAVAFFDAAAQFAVIAAAMTACLLPLLLTRAAPAARPVPVAAGRAAARIDLVIAWVARLCVQVAGGVLFHYLFFYFESVTAAAPPRAVAARLGGLMTFAYALPLPIAVLLGRMSDRARRAKPFLLGTAMVAAAGLATMALAPRWGVAAAGFTLYAVGSAAFLALHATFAMRLLPSGRRRGRDLGLLNLTNTLPSIIGPALAWTLAGPRDFAALMLALAALTAVGGLGILAVRGQR